MSKSNGKKKVSTIVYLHELVSTWKKDGKWRVAPADLDWIEEGNHIKVGKGVVLDTDEAEIGRNVIIGDDCHIGRSSTLSDGARLKNRVTLNSCVGIGCDVTIGSNTVIQIYSEIGSKTRIGKNVIVQTKISIGENCRIAEGAVVKDSVENNTTVLG